MNSISRSASRASTNTSAKQDSPSASQNAALLGATLAFKQPLAGSPIPSSGGPTGDGARFLTVKAASTGNGSPDRQTQDTIGRRGTGRSVSRNRDVEGATNTSQSANLAPPQQGRRMHSRSPSQAAAALAVARASPARTEDMTLATGRPPVSAQTSKPTARPVIAPKTRPLSEYHPSQNSTALDPPTDTSSIPPTTSLISLFERRSSVDQLPRRRPDPIVVKPVQSLAIKSPKPVRRSDGISSVFQMELESASQAQTPSHVRETKDEETTVVVEPAQAERVEGKSEGSSQQRRDNQASRAGQSGRIVSRAAKETGDHQERSNDRGSQERGQVRKIRDGIEATKGQTQNSQSNQVRTRASIGKGVNGENTSLQPSQAPGNGAKLLSPDRSTSPTSSLSNKPRLSPTPLPYSQTNASPIDIPASTGNTNGPHEMLSTSSQSAMSLQATYHQLHPKRITPLTTGDKADAIVASSLASSRLSSPHRLEPPPVPPSRRHSNHRHIFQSRTPSPVKTGLRHTLRKEESSDSESQDDLHPYSKHQKKRLIRKHPNKHHEGDRKRWRDAVTERERKRYEGVWAANRGLHIRAEGQRGSSKESKEVLTDQVSNVVVKDIWSRSRLPDTELETVWDLVDSQCLGRLSKQEFVVGMWLIDQRLKGRKLPVKVTATVWASVRGLQGIKIRK